MNHEERRGRIRVSKASGTAGPLSKGFRVALPPAWVRQMGLTEQDREIILQFDGECITIRRAGLERYEDLLVDARAKRHSILILYYYNGQTLCTKICADQTIQRLAIENLASDPLSTAFGVNEEPDWGDLEDFLESRCVPRQRDGLSRYLAQLGLEQYDPLEIIRKTEGRMAEDHFWIKIVEG